MKGKVKNIFKYSIITACIFIFLVLVYTAIMGYFLINESERINDSTEVFKEYGETFEKKIEGVTENELVTENERIVEEGRGIYIMIYSRQAHIATELLLIMFVGMIVGAGIGYVNAVDDISKANGKKMFVMYGIGVIILILICYIYNNITKNAGPEILTALITASLPILVYTLIYVLAILYKIIENRKKKDVLNELLKKRKAQ